MRLQPVWRTLLVAAALLTALLAASFPYLEANARRPPGSLFWAVPTINYSDACQYLAFAREARDGHLLLGDAFTTEPHQPRLFVPQSQWEGLLCRVLSITPLEAFQTDRVLCGALLLGVGWWFGTLLLPLWRQRWLYLALLCFGGGAGWFTHALHLSKFHGGILQPEANTFAMLGNIPNISFAAALLTGLFGTLIAYERKPAAGWLVAALICSALLSWTHPWDFLTYVAGVSLYAAVRWWQCGQFPRRLLEHAVVVGLAALPAAAYLSWITRADPFYRALADDHTQVKEFWYYFVPFAFLVPGATLAFTRGRLRPQILLPLCWAAPCFLILLTPFNLGGKQTRLLGGVHVPLAVLAAAGIERLARRRGVWLPAAYALLCATGSLDVASQQRSDFRKQPVLYYLPADVQSAFRELERRSAPGDIVVGGNLTSSWAPVLAPVRVYHGHWHLTLHAQEKAAEEQRFFFSWMRWDERAAWLQQRGAQWVIWYPREWSTRPADLDQVPGLEPVYVTPEIRLYRFTSGIRRPL